MEESEVDGAGVQPFQAAGAPGTISSVSCVFRVVERARVRAEPHGMASTLHFCERGDEVQGVLIGRWVLLGTGGFVLRSWSDGAPILVPHGVD